jgi:hypothetical protein
MKPQIVVAINASMGAVTSPAFAGFFGTARAEADHRSSWSGECVSGVKEIPNCSSASVQRTAPSGHTAWLETQQEGDWEDAGNPS